MHFDDLCARDLMSRKIETCDPDLSVLDALRKMDALSIHCLVVPPPRAGRSIGIISIKDIVQLLGDAGPEILEELVVEEVVTMPVVTLPDDLQIHDCINLMRMTGVRTAPVMEGREVVGLLSYSDVVRWIARNA